MRILFWQGGFALLVFIYAVLADRDGRISRVRNIQAGIAIAMAMTGAAAIVLILRATAGHDLLTPIMMLAEPSTLVSKGISRLFVL